MNVMQTRACAQVLSQPRCRLAPGSGYAPGVAVGGELVALDSPARLTHPVAVQQQDWWQALPTKQQSRSKF